MDIDVQSLNLDIENISNSLKEGFGLGKNFVDEAFEKAEYQSCPKKEFTSDIRDYARGLGIGHENGTFTDILDLRNNPVAEE